MEQYFNCSKQIMVRFKAVEVEQIPKAKNFRVDILARMLATSYVNLPKSIPVEVKTFPSIEQEAKVMYLDTGKLWMDPIISYIRDGTLLIDKRQARKLKC